MPRSRHLAGVLLLLTAPVWAHVVSMSSSDLVVSGTKAHFQLRMPMYEVSHVARPEVALLEHMHFGGARLAASTCAPDRENTNYVCEAEYEFPAPVDRVEVECTLAAITVPNHVHLLRASLGGKQDQGIFDVSFTRTTLLFRPPTRTELALSQAGAGAMRALGGAAQLLFLAALVVAARNRRELLVLAATFLAGQIISVLLMPHLTWQPPPRFVEAAAALSIAYLAVEVLLLPQAGSRWAIVGVLGIFHGLYLHLFLQGTGYSAFYVLAGAGLAEIAAVSILALIYSRLRLLRALRPVQVSAVALLGFGLAWFAMRLRG